MADPKHERNDDLIGISSDEVNDLRNRINGLLSEIADNRLLRNGMSAEEVLDRQQRIKRIQKARRLRGRFLRPQLFADPAWDMLLELYGDSLNGARVSVSGLCYASGVPPTTALRWIQTLVSQDLVVKTDDPLDARRVLMELSPQGITAMDAYFAAMPFGGDAI